MELKKKMQENKQLVSIMREEGGGEEGIEAYRPADVSTYPGLVMREEGGGDRGIQTC